MHTKQISIGMKKLAVYVFLLITSSKTFDYTPIVINNILVFNIYSLIYFVFFYINMHNAYIKYVLKLNL